ncbi:RnfABCDGE type electron transport complex subunit D [Candidatus Woesebacteria bacterium]|nr:RnfABCDGE type electron transport complex subunit D [Candidatus Woesebacteria bacterium]
MITDLQTYFKLKNTLSQFLIFLLVFAILGFSDIFFRSPALDQHHMILIVMTCLVSIVISIFVLRKILNRVDLNPLNIIVTGIIIFLLVHPTNTLILFVMSIFFAMCSKLVRFRSQPILNPAAAGLTAAFYFSKFLTSAGILQEPLLITWWAADMMQNISSSMPFINYLFGAAILGLFIYFMNHFKKAHYSISFCMTVFCLMFFTNLKYHASSSETIDFILASFFNSFAFLTLVMLPEPKTSPVFTKQQVVVAVLTGMYFYYAALRGVPIIGTENAMVETVIFTNLLTLFFKSNTLFR